VLESLYNFPFAFWVVIIILVCGAIYAMNRLADGTGAPMFAVLGTVGVWYAGDAIYNDYTEHHMALFTDSMLTDAWSQIAWFLISFLLLTPHIHRYFNARVLNNRSQVISILRNGIENREFQYYLLQTFYACLVVWLMLLATAIYLVGEDAYYYLFPFMGEKVNPWARNRVGSGADALLSLAGYCQLFVAGTFGVVLSLTKYRWVALIALAGCFLTWPFYLLDRTRNTMLSCFLPALLAWVFLRLRAGLLVKIGVIALCFLVVEGWLAFVIANRTQTSISTAVKQKGFSLKKDETTRHRGLNMFEELCWINTFFHEGSFEPNYGKRYLAELANPIPRSIWPDKPYGGLDYAILRGQGGGEAEQGGVHASISAGVIGQGVINFGRYLGPPFAALLMSLWVSILARLDLGKGRIGGFQLYMLGLVLTFNLGRDITILTLYPFLFGLLISEVAGRFRASSAGTRASIRSIRRPAIQGKPYAPPHPASRPGTIQ
jgi:hypothetical protein